MGSDHGSPKTHLRVARTDFQLESLEPRYLVTAVTTIRRFEEPSGIWSMRDGNDMYCFGDGRLLDVKMSESTPTVTPLTPEGYEVDDPYTYPPVLHDQRLYFYGHSP